ncbi:MAG: septation protein SpoVG family protein [Faecalimonas sp.]|nr:septation protein SpoVG family protein [Faecalimonas sp.]
MKYSIKVNEVQGNDSHIKGFATVVFGGAFKISNIAILENRETGDLFVSMPRYKSRGVDQDNNPIYKDICNPTTKEFREQLYGDIMDAYHALKEKDKAQDTVAQEEVEMPEFSILVTAWSSKDSNVRGLASIYFEDCFIVNNVSILQGKENLFVAMPSYKTKKVDDNNKPIYSDYSDSLIIPIL